MRVWASIDDFVTRATLERGVDVIRLPSGDHLDVIVGGRPGDDDTCVPVFFGGAMPSRPQHTPPFFSGHNLGKLAGGRYLAFSDPLVAAEADLTLGWYAGRAGDHAQETIARVLELAHRHWGQELLLVGGSGGGFAALEQLRRARVPTSAFVWNPQTDIRNYHQKWADAYLRAALGLSRPDLNGLSDAERVDRARAAGIELSTLGRPVAAHGSGGRLLVLQNATDAHVVEHMGPYLDRSELTGGADARWVGDREVWLVADTGEGHAVPPRETLEGAFLGMVRVGADPVRVAADLRGSGLAPLPPVADLPVDLRGRHDASLGRAGLRLTVDERGVHRLWFDNPQGLPAGSIPRYRSAGSGRLAALPRSGTAWLGTTPSPVDVQLRDGLGHTVDEMRPLPAPHYDAPALLLVGSCVSRDLIEYADHEVSVVGYHARQSLISAFSAGTTAPAEVASLASPFQRRQLEADFESRLPEQVRASAGGADLLVWDLVDERGGVFVHPDGVVTTDTIEWRRLHPHGGPPPGARRVAFGSDEHRVLFREALRSWRALLEETGLLQRTVLLAPRWADRTTSGQPVPPSFGMSAAEGSRIQAEYVEMVREIVGVTVLGDDLVTAAGDDHRWGPAAFHFDDETERRLASSVLGRLTTRRPVGGPTRADGGAVLSVGPVGTNGVLAVGHVPEDAKVAFHLVHGGSRVAATTYGPARSHTFWKAPSGRCVVRMFVMDPDGSRRSVTSVGVTVPKEAP